MKRPCFKNVLPSFLYSLLILLIIPSCTYDSLEFQPDCTGVIELELVEVQASTCNQNAGSIKVVVNNNTDPDLSFSIDGVNFQSEGEFTNLAAAAYTLIARSKGCEESLNVQVENAEGLNANLSTIAADCGGTNGAVEVTVNNATGAVEYQLNNGAPQSSNTFNNLAPGSYTLIARDDAGCEVSLEATVNSDIEYANVEAIISSSCAVSGCHAGNVSPDFRVKENILNNANQIKSRTAARSMPPSSSGISLTAEEIETISCWVNDGAQG